MALRMIADHTELTFQYMRLEGRVETLLEFLLRRFRYLDEQEWRANISAERVCVDGRIAQADQRLRSQQKIVYLRPDFLEPSVDPYFEIIYEDQDLTAVCKSGNLPTSPSGKYFKNTLANLIKIQFGWKKLYTLHRLDRETSGIVLFAKKHGAAQIMAEHFRKQRVRKIYSAILSRHLPQNLEANLTQKTPEVYLSLPLGPDLKSEIRIKQGVNPQGKVSQTYFREVEKLGDYSKVEVRPYSGRTHQIRVHAAYIGCPIVGDKLYGLPDEDFIHWLNEGEAYLRSRNFPFHRQLLHAQEVCFPHPATGKETVIRADEDILFREFEKHNLNLSR